MLKLSSPVRLGLACCAALLLGTTVVGCAELAVRSAAPKVASTTRSPQALKADESFWQALHGGDYEAIQSVLNSLTAAYLADPNDGTSAAHIGFLHIWRLAESGRQSKLSPTVTDDATLARKYFSEAHRLQPDDARFLGFLGSTTSTEAGIHGDEAGKRRGYYLLKEAIAAWPEFNYFTAGYSLSQLPYNSPRYAEAMEYMWRNVGACTDTPINRTQPNYVPARVSQVERSGEKVGEIKRACGNSWIAPHNFEGFFLAMGDMLVKQGDWQTAQKIYANAKQSPDYASWPYAAELEKRIAAAEQNVAAFRATPMRGDTSTPRIMIQSTHACMACHQK